MSIFKIRLLSEVQKDLIREIKIRSDQTFKDLHDVIINSLGLDGEELASFHIANDNWEKLVEITLIDMSGKEDEELENDDKVQTVFVMSETKLNRFLEETGQKLIYEYDFLQLQTFLLELIEIGNPRKNSEYPKVTLSKGTLKLQDNKMAVKDPEELKKELLKEALRIGMIYAEKRGAATFEETDGHNLKIEYVYRLLVHDKRIQPLAKGKEDMPGMRHKLAIWISKNLPADHPLLK